MYKIELTFLNTYNSVVSFSPNGKNIRENNLSLQAQASKVYLQNKKIIIQKYNDSFSTELVSNDVFTYCFASLKNHKILFNLFSSSSSPLLKEVSKISLEQLEFVHNIKAENILGKFKVLLKSGTPFEFRIINTCDAFLDYVKLNGGYPSRSVNKDLLSAFIQCLQCNITDEVCSGSICMLQSKEGPHTFKYIQFYDLILILEYRKHILK
jgi:hypothetical protein